VPGTCSGHSSGTLDSGGGQRHHRPRAPAITRLEEDPLPRRQTRGPTRDVRPARAGTPARRRRWPRAAGAAALALGAAFALWFARSPRAPAPADPAAGLDPERAYEIGIGLAKSNRCMESLPYFLRAAEAPGGTTWRVRHDYSSALHNAAHESRTVAGHGRRVARSSVERIAMMRESLRQLDLAAAIAGAARDRAFIEAIRGTTLETWGFPLDALECYQRAFPEEFAKSVALQTELARRLGAGGGGSRS